MYKHSNRILAKTSMLTFLLAEVIERYPDYEQVYIIRDPVEVIPSGMSLSASVRENGYNMWDHSSKEDHERWIENLYQASCDIHRRVLLVRSRIESRSTSTIPSGPSVGRRQLALYMSSRRSRVASRRCPSEDATRFTRS